MTQRSKSRGAGASVRPAPEAEHLCRKGHVMDYVYPSGRRGCRTCHKRRWRARGERRRQERLKERRARIAARARPPRTVRVWAAGHFEGEGTFSILSGGSGTLPRPVARLASTDKSMVDVFQEHWPGFLGRYTAKSGCSREVFTWLISRFDVLEGFILDIRPFLISQRMREKAALLLEDVRARAELRRSRQAYAAMHARHMKMRELNRRGVRRKGEDGG